MNAEKSGAQVPPDAPSADIKLQILGSPRIWHRGVELDAGPRQQAYLLAVLLARAGRPLGVDGLIDLIWDRDDPPASALNVIHKYVGALRRLLEPGLPSRGVSAYLQRRGDSYVFSAQPQELDLLDFRHRVAAAKAALAQPGNETTALEHYAYALDLWRGPAGEGLVHGTPAEPIFAVLDDEFLDACTAGAELAVSVGQPERVLAPLRLAASMSPLHEPVGAGLIRVLGACGKRAEALASYRAIRNRLVEDLGIDPGAALVTAHEEVLRRTDDSVRGDATVLVPRGPKRNCEIGEIVGRSAELGLLRRGIADATSGRSALFVVEGEPGAGKTRLLLEVAAEAERAGVTVAWGRCQQGFDVPAMWLWSQIVRAVLEILPSEERVALLDTPLGTLVELRDGVLDAPVEANGMAQFRLFETVAGLLRQVAAQGTLVLMLDDLQWADVESLQLTSHLAAQLPTRTVLVGAIRDRVPVPGPQQARALAELSRQPIHRRIRLRPLRPDDVAAIVRDETGHDPDPDAARIIHARSGGNPFFARELARFLAEGGSLTTEYVARAGVPATVRDVVVDRMAALTREAESVLKIAALIGGAVDLGLLSRAAGLDAQACLDVIEPLEALGLLEATPGDPNSLRFPHDLIRESVADGVSGPLAARLHLRVAEAMAEDDRATESRAEGLAFHLWAAGPLIDPARTTRALIRSGRGAAAKSACETAEQRLRMAVDVARAAGLDELELAALSELIALLGPRRGFVGPLFTLMERAEHLARLLRRDQDAADFLLALMIGNSQSLQTERAGQMARRLLELSEAAPDAVVRGHALYAWGWHQWEIGAIGQALRSFDGSEEALPQTERRGQMTLRRVLQQIRPAMHALLTGMHGDLDGARRRFEAIVDSAGDDVELITLWALFDLMLAGMAGDPELAGRIIERRTLTLEHPNAYYLDIFTRLCWCWARACTGDDPHAAATEAETILTRHLLNPPMGGVAFNCALVADALLAADDPVGAARVLDLAEEALDTYGQRYAEGLVLVVRARLLQSRGEPVAAVRAAAERARALSVEREAHLFGTRAEKLLAVLPLR